MMTRMGAKSPSARRLIIAGAFVAAAAAPAITFVAAAPVDAPARLADCPSGEEGDLFTDSCIPYLAPNSPAAPETGGTQISPPGPQMPGPVQPGQPEEELQDISTPDF